MNTKMWIAGMRPKTLPASIAPVLVGAALAWNQAADLRWRCAVGLDADEAARTCGDPLQASGITAGWFWGAFVGCLIVALALQVAVNFANDYSDGVRGVDAGRTLDSRSAVSPSAGRGPTPPSSEGGEVPVSLSSEGGPAQGGAPGRLVASGVPPKRVLAAAGIAAGVACVVGLVVIIAGGRWGLLVVGVASLLAGWFYTGGKHPYGYRGWGEVFVFLFFGPVAVAGTQYAILGSLGLSARLTPAAVAAGLNAAVLLLVNNIRDIPSDRESGKRTYASRVGLGKATVTLYVLLALSVIVSLSAFGALPMRWGGVTVPSVVVAVPLAFAAVPAWFVHRMDYRRALSTAGLFTLVSALAWCAALIGHGLWMGAW